MSMRILGTGSAVPKKIITNDDLTKMVDTSDEWIVSRTGMSNRRVSTGETMTELTVKSSLLALENSNTSPEELDLIICATICGDYITPSQASLIQKEIGADCPAFDINAACSGFIYALDIAHGYILSGKAKKILVVAYDVLSKFVDWKDRNTCVLFGDGGGAVVVGEGKGLLGIKLTSEGNAGILNIPCHNSSPFDKDKAVDQHLKMNGSEVFKFAVSRIVSEMEGLLKDCGISKEEVDLVLLHQANIRIIKSAVSKLKMPEEKFLSNIEKYGNTSAGSIPILLDELNSDGVIKDGDVIAMVAFGGGLTTGACLLEWHAENK
jgi:3-oxoacyl-[acyl-carrier-protein] synthase III